MAGQQTREKLLDIGEQHFARTGYGATSLRGVMAEAGVNPAAVHYHFGGKLQLFAAIVERRLDPMNKARLEQLDNLEQAAEGRLLAVDDIIEAFLKPLFDLVCQRYHGAAWRRLILLYRLEPGEHWLCVEAVTKKMVERYLAAFARVLPELSPAEIAYRFHFLGGTAVDAFSDLQSLRLFFPEIDGIDDDRAGLLAAVIRFTAAGMKAPLG